MENYQHPSLRRLPGFQLVLHRCECKLRTAQSVNRCYELSYPKTVEDEQLQLALGMSASLNPPAAVAEDRKKSTGEMASYSAAERSVEVDTIHTGQRPMVKKMKPLNSKGSK